MAAWPIGHKRWKLATSDGPIKRIYVNKHIIGANNKNGTNDPAITVRTSAGTFVVRNVDILGPSVIVDNPPLSCGARVYVETRAKLAIELF